MKLIIFVLNSNKDNSQRESEKSVIRTFQL